MTSISILTEPLPDDPKWRWDPANPRRGTEEFYVETAHHLARLGHDVAVYYDVPTHGWLTTEYDSGKVEFRPRKQMRGADVAITCNHHGIDDFEIATKRAVYWTNLYGEVYDAKVHGHYDAIILISAFQASVFRAPPEAPIFVIGHGCDPARLTPAPKAPICAFTSSPDRGLAFLQGIWPEVEAKTGYRLVATNGTMTNDEVDALYRSAKFWLHPGLGVELFCLSALKAQVAGCIPVVVPHMALAETVRGGVRCDLFQYREALIEAIRNPPVVPMPPDGGWPTWASVTAAIAELL